MPVLTKSQITEAFLKVRNYSEQICSKLETEDYIPQPITDVSPPKWHLGHTTWFFEEFILKKYFSAYTVFNTDFNFLFNSYYDSVGERVSRENRGFLSRPTVREIYEYRAYVDSHIKELLDQEVRPELTEIVTLGLNHEQQHQELLWTDIKYILGTQPTYPSYSKGNELRHQHSCDRDYIRLPEAEHEIGFKGKGFHFDNEENMHLVKIPAFAIRKGLVSNGEYLEFMNEGGYGDFRFWHSEGWAWVVENRIDAPLYWHKKGDKWYHYTLEGLREVDPDEPLCHVSYYEASAFANYTGYRLPTEFEWEAASGKIPWGDRWEWTNSAYLPYPGYKPVPGALGEYNGKFMVSQMVLRGASVATPPGHSRKTYRNFWHPKYRWQFMGIRLVRDKYLDD